MEKPQHFRMQLQFKFIVSSLSSQSLSSYDFMTYVTHYAKGSSDYSVHPRLFTVLFTAAVTIELLKPFKIIDCMSEVYTHLIM